jgi:hypothetical protein
VINFRRAIIKEHRGKYYIERAVIKVGPDGTITCSEFNKDDPRNPSEAEQADVRRQWTEAGLPKQVVATKREAEEYAERLDRDDADKESVTFLFYDRESGKVVMVQQRIEVEGKRSFIPWTLFSDGCWRRFEPDTGLPLWKPERETGKEKIMIHEGAKAAKHCQRLVDEQEAHPWLEELSEYEHWGMIGGAMVPQRTNWEELKKAKPTEVVYVCDNDLPGREALQRVSRHYRRSMKGVQFDGKFKESWDLADPMPEEMWDSMNRWTGPSLRAYMRPATWATDELPNPGGRGRPAIVINLDFAREWHHSIRPELFVHKDWPSDTYTKDEFNNKTAPYSDAANVADKLQKYDASKAVELRYVPHQPPGIFHQDGTLCLNTHRPSSVTRVSGDASIFEDYMEHLIPIERDRVEVLKWITTLVARPDIRMKYGLLLISEVQGVGKSTLGEKILAPLVGWNNVSVPSTQDVVDSNFDYWSVRKRLSIIHEIYEGGNKKAYDRLKSIMTEDNRTVNQKYLANYTIECWVHIFASSNSRVPIKISGDDRRWLIPAVTEVKRTSTFWNEFNGWLTRENGLGIVMDWLYRRAEDVRNVVSPSDDAPLTEAKDDVVIEGYSEGQRLTLEVLSRIRDEAREANQKIVVIDTELRRMIKEIIHEGRHTSYLETPHTLRKIAKRVGFKINKHRIEKARWGGVPCYSGRALAYSPNPADVDGFEDKKVAELFAGVPPVDVVTKAREYQVI